MQILSKFFKILVVLLGLSAFCGGGYFLLNNKNGSDIAVQPGQTQSDIQENDEIEKETPTVKQELPETETKTAFSNASLDVPFTVQAPAGKWSDPLFQNGCEEATVAMAMAWVNEKTLSSQRAEQEIRAISAWEEKTFGFAVDTSTEDTARIVREYYGHQKVAVLKNISAKDIKEELSKGRLVLVQMNGKKLANPHYTPPGPDEHMLVVIGYDEEKKEFITNDPGTKFGKDYRYGEELFMAAIWSYPTGAKHASYPGPQKVSRDAISLWK